MARLVGLHLYFDGSDSSSGRGISFGIATGYGLDGPEI